MFSCGGGEKYNLGKLEQQVGAKPVELPGKEKEHVEALVKAIFPQGWKVIEVFGIKTSEEPYLKKYLAVVYNPYQHAVFYRFIWITTDGKYLTANLYRINKGSVDLILPKKAVEHPLEDLRWLLDIERIALSQNLPLTLTEGKRYVYIVWNPYCESCFNCWKELVRTAKKERLGIKIIPYHNVYYPLDNLYMLIYILHRAKSEGLFTVLNGYYSNSKSFTDFLQRLKRDAFANLSKIPKKEFNDIGYSLEAISKDLKAAKVLVVPTTVWVKNINPSTGSASGYVYVGSITLKPTGAVK
jgi:hypothetical protein